MWLSTVVSSVQVRTIHGQFGQGHAIPQFPVREIRGASTPALDRAVPVDHFISAISPISPIEHKHRLEINDFKLRLPTSAHKLLFSITHQSSRTINSHFGIMAMSKLQHGI